MSLPTGLTPLAGATLVITGIALAGLLGAGAFALLRRRATAGLAPRTALARAGSYAGLAAVLVVTAWAGVAGIAVLVLGLSVLGLVEWSRLFDLPIHHRIALLVAAAAVVAGVAVLGASAADWLVGGLVLVGATWPVLRVDTGRAVRDLGMAAVGFIVIPVMLVHAVALVVARGEGGLVVFLALAVACAAADVAAFVVGRRFGRTPLVPRLSPNKTRVGVVGNLVGAAIGIGLFTPMLVPVLGGGVTLALVPLVAGGSVWGDLLESAVKREAGVKDAGTWLPGFGGILDRIDSLLVTVALAYWLIRLAVPLP